MTIRFIEYMDVETLNGWKMDEVLTSKEVHDMIHQEIPLKPVQSTFLAVTTRYRYRGTDVEGGFISSLSGAFCSDCTRMRLSADGKSIHAICLKRR